MAFGLVVPTAINLCNDILLITKQHRYDLQAASARTDTVRLPEGLGIPAAAFTVQGDTARFAVRVWRYNTRLHLLRHLPLAPTLTSRLSLARILTPALLFKIVITRSCCSQSVHPTWSQ